MNFSGLITAAIVFFAIGLGFVWVIRLEYYVGSHVARALGFAGVLICALSALLPGFWPSAIVGVLGGTVFWGATELPDQAARVARGQFPANPRKKERRI